MSSQEIGIASECIGAVVAISASLDFEDVRRAVYKMKTFFTRDGDFWPARRLATVYSFGFAFLLSFIEIAIGLEELPNAISDPGLQYTIIGLGGAKALLASMHYVDMRMQNMVTGVATSRKLHNTSSLQGKRAWLIYLIDHWQKHLKRFNDDTIQAHSNKLETY